MMFLKTNTVITLWGVFRIQSNIRDGTLHKSSPQRKTDSISANRPTWDVWLGSEHASIYNLSLDPILKIENS